MAGGCWIICCFALNSPLAAHVSVSPMTCSGTITDDGKACGMHDKERMEGDFDIQVLRDIVTLVNLPPAVTLLRLMLTALVLLAQAWPAQAVVNGSDTAACEMGCCALLEEAGIIACGCTDAPASPSPARTPPASARDLVPPVTWVSVEDEKPSAPSARSIDSITWNRPTQADKAQPHVRLAVLFCSFLN